MKGAGDNVDRIRSSHAGMVWPVVPPAEGALALALQFQFARSEWQDAETLAAHQLRQLRELFRHAHATVPYYRDVLEGAGYRAGAAFDWSWFRRLPLLTRSDLQRHGLALRSIRVPESHAPVTAGHTSGSTGMPVEYLSTAVTRCFWRAFNLRDQLWHRRDLSLRFAGIRPDRDVHGAGGVDLDAWGPSTHAAFLDGPSGLLHSANTIDRQIEWLSQRRPAYLLTLASNLRELARELDRRKMHLPGLREACTYGDTLGPAERAECRRLLGVPVTDIYSAQETGYIALQCPEYDCYHVQAEGIVVELLDDRGAPCSPGAAGRVVLTPLHNLAMPLIRYEIGDYAEAGEPCGCGRGLPVIRRVLGRSRNMARTPDGRRYFPSFAAERWMRVAPVLQLQLVQKSLLRIEANVVCGRPLAATESAALADALRASLGHPYEVVVVPVERIPRSPSGKYEDFRCEM